MARFRVAGLILAVLLFAQCGVAIAADDAQDRRERAAQVKEAAEAGKVQAQLELGYMYAAGGYGVRRSYKDAAAWWEKAYAQGNARAAYFLATLYMRGKGEPKDIDHALALLKESAQKGDSFAMAYLGDLYLTGKLVDQNVKVAIDWFNKALKLNDAEAERQLGIMRMTGNHLPKDPKEGVRLLRASAEQGYGPGMFALAVAINDGLGTKPDSVEAYIWARRAEAQKDKKAGKLAEQIGAKLPASQRADADRQAANWHPGHDSRGGDDEDDGQADANANAGASGGAPRIVATGSGFFINAAGDLVTNHHVIAGCTKLEAGNHALGMASTRVVADDQPNDLAVLEVNRKPVAIAKLRSGPIRQAEAVLAYGFPLTGALASDGNATSGAITALAGLGDDTRFYQTSAPVQPGNSGGPLVDMSGNVVGVIDAKLNALAVAKVTNDIPQNVNFALKVAVAQNFLDSHSIAYETAPAGPARSAPDVSDAARAFTMLVTCWK
jgi:TPR repeat protein